MGGTWLMNGNWCWCAIAGHSLGGGIAQIKAAELALGSKSRPVLLAILGSPSAGSKEFADRLRERVLPKPGGVRVWNEGDMVPWSTKHLVPYGLRSFAGLEIMLGGV